MARAAGLITKQQGGNSSLGIDAVANHCIGGIRVATEKIGAGTGKCALEIGAGQIKKLVCSGAWASNDGCVAIGIAGNGLVGGGLSPWRRVVDGNVKVTTERIIAVSGKCTLEIGGRQIKNQLCNGTWATDDSCNSIDVAGNGPNGWAGGELSPWRGVVDGNVKVTTERIIAVAGKRTLEIGGRQIVIE